MHNSVAESNHLVVVVGESLTCTKTLQVFVQELSYCWKWNARLGASNYQRLRGLFLKSVFNSCHVGITYSRTSGTGFMTRRFTISKLLMPLSQRIFGWHCIFIFCGVTPSNSGHKPQLNEFSHIFCFLQHWPSHIWKMHFREILW